MRVLVGTSGYSYPAWKGRFYPKTLPTAQMLSYYAGLFPTVEINHTFYRMPTEASFLTLSTQTPAPFSVAVKCPGLITHRLRLAGAAEPMARFAAACSALGGKLGPILVQLPPTLEKDLPRLADFLAAIPPARKVACEFRHASWFADDVYALLRERQASLCVADADDLSTPLEATAPWGYLRLRRDDYDAASLRRWSERILAQRWSVAYAFFKHEDQARGTVFAAQLADLVKAR
jgi:uncharacterized protein YecE (DUF72 family)